MLGGSFIVGAMGIMYSVGDESAKDSTLGVILMVIATGIAGLYYTSQEMIMVKLHIDVFMEVFIEGVWGCLIFFILIPMVKTVRIEGNLMDDLDAWLYQVGQ